MRFSLRWLLFAVAVVAFWTVAFIRPSQGMRTATTTIVWSSLVLAALVAVGCQDRRRIFAAGYVVATLAYFYPVMYRPESDRLHGPTELVERHIVQPFHAALVPVLFNRLLEPGDVVEEDSPGNFYVKNRLRYSWGDEVHFTRMTVHLSMAMLLGCLGGSLVMFLRSRSEPTGK